MEETKEDRPESTQSTQALIGRIIAGEETIYGDEAAYDDLLQRVRTPLLTWVRLREGRLRQSPFLTGNDVVQRVLMRMLDPERIKRFDGQAPGSLVSYLITAVRNQISNDLRDRRAAQEALRDLTRKTTDNKPSPLDGYLGRELLERFDEAIQRLPEELQAMIFARFEVGMSFREIKEQFGLGSTDAARKRIKRALDAIEKELIDGN